MPRNKNTSDPAARKVLAVLRAYYSPSHPSARIEVYRYNSASIRVRVIDPEFARISPALRDTEVWSLFRDNLPEDILSQISLILLLSPEEQSTSLMNAEFEDPIPSRL